MPMVLKGFQAATVAICAGFAARAQGIPPSCEHAYVAELTTTAVTDVTRTGWPGEDLVIPDDQFLRSIEANNASRKSRIRAVAWLRAGVHGRWVVTFAEGDKVIDVVATYLFWGQIGEKRIDTMSIGGFKGVIQRVEQTTHCTSEVEESTYFAAFASWSPRGERRVCELEDMDQKSLSEMFEPILNEARNVYSRPPQTESGPRQAGAWPSEPIVKTEVPYPSGARERAVGGKVLVEVTVDVGGRVVNTRVIRCDAPGFGFEEAAMAAIRSWRWQPARCAESEPRGTAFEVTFKPGDD